MNTVKAILTLGTLKSTMPDPTTHILYTEASSSLPPAKITFDNDGSTIESCQFSVSKLLKSGITPYTIANSSNSGTILCNAGSDDNSATTLSSTTSIKSIIYLMNGGNVGNVSLSDITSSFVLGTPNTCNVAISNHKCDDLKFVATESPNNIYVMQNNNTIITPSTATPVFKSFGTINKIEFLDSSNLNPIEFKFNVVGNAQFNVSLDKNFGASTNINYAMSHTDKINFDMQDNQSGDIVFGNGAGLCPTSATCSSTLNNTPSTIAQAEYQDNATFDIKVDYLHDNTSSNNYLKTSLVNVTVVS